MNIRLLCAAVCAAISPVLLPAQSPSNQPPAEPGKPAAQADSPPIRDLKALIARTNEKLTSGRPTAASLAPEIAAFDELLEKYRDQKTEDVAQIAVMKAALFQEVLGDLESTKKILLQIKADFPGTETAGAVDEALVPIEREIAANKVRDALIGKSAPELNFKWIDRDGVKKLSDLKGKVVVLDFWATWCGPCVASFPDIQQLAARYKDSDVVIIGVTSIQGAVVGLEARPINTEGNPEKEISLMKDYIKAKGITWTIAISEEAVANPAYGIQGIPYMAVIAPDGTVRHAGIHPADPDARLPEKIDAVLKEFSLKAPAIPEKS